MAKIRTFKDVRKMFEQVKEEIDQENSGGNFSLVEGKYWKPFLPKNEDKVNYKIRFLPNLYSETGKPYVLRKLHAFGPDGNKFYENCRKSIGEKCYLCDQINPLFDSENPADNKIAMSRFGKKRYFANVLVIEDSREDGALEGKVFIFQFGKKIKEKLDKAVRDDFPYYDVYEGATFDLEVKWISKYQNYDTSEFSRTSTKLFDGDEEKLEEIAKQCYDLDKEVLNDDIFNSYEEQSVRYNAYQNGEKVDGSFGKKKKETKTKIKEETTEEDSGGPNIAEELESAVEEMTNNQNDNVPSPFDETTEEEETSVDSVQEKSEDDDFDIDEFEKELETEFK